MADRPIQPGAEAAARAHPPLRLLHLEDDALDAELIASTLADAGVRAEIDRAATPEEFAAALRVRPDLILADYRVPRFEGLQALEQARRAWPTVPFVFVTGALGEELAVQTLRSGATDFVLKERLGRLGPVVDRALREADDRERRRRAETALRESEERFRLAAEAITGLVYDWDVATGAVVRTTGLFSLVGFQPEEASPDAAWWRERIHPEDIEGVDAAWKAALERRAERYTAEYRVRHRDGRWIYIWDRGLIVYDDRGGVARAVGSATDVTGRVEAERTLSRHRDQLEELVRERTEELMASHQRLRLTERMAALGTLAAGLGHDMGNLLLPIRMHLDSIDKEAVASEVRDDLVAIGRCVEYLQRLTDGLRLFAADPDAPQNPDERTGLSEWWQDIHPFLRNALGKGVTLAGEIDPSVPPVHLARHRLTQAVFNLVQNAGDALRSRGTGSVRVIARAEPGEPLIRIAVGDDGPGMTADVKARCLEPFFSTKTRGLSTGLGLALVHGIAQQAGGRVEIESSPGRGTTVALLLPVASAAAPPAPLDATVSVADGRLREILSSLLSESGVRVRRADRPDPGAVLWIADAAHAPAPAAGEFLAGHRVLVLVGAEGPGGAAGAGKEREGALTSAGMTDLRVPAGAPLSALRDALRAAVARVRERGSPAAPSMAPAGLEPATKGL